VLSVSVGATITAAGVSRIRYYNPFFAIGSVLFAIGAGLITTLGANAAAHQWIGYQVCLGLGVGFVLLANAVPGQICLAEQYHSIANGITFLCSMLGA